MADEELDICECIWDKMAVQRLLSIVREMQNHCTDTECFTVSRQTEPHDVSASSNFLMTCLIIAFFVVMFAFRPSALRSHTRHNTKDRDNEPDSNGDPASRPSTAH